MRIGKQKHIYPSSRSPNSKKNIKKKKRKRQFEQATSFPHSWLYIHLILANLDLSARSNQEKHHIPTKIQNYNFDFAHGSI